MAGERYEYLLDGFGWDSEIQFAGDLDRDGRPDFIVYVNGNNAGTWYVLLSSEAKPGMNEPAASLTASRMLSSHAELPQKDRNHGHGRSGRTFRPRRGPHATG